MKKRYLITWICCLALIPVYAAGMMILYGDLAVRYGRPDHFLVNITGIAGLLGTIALIAVGIVNLVKWIRRR